MKNPYRLLFFVCLLLHFIPAGAQQDKDLQKYYADQILTNGVLTNADLTLLPYVDIKRIMDHNFDSDRAYDTRQQVKLKYGPVIELESITERQRKGIKIDSAIIADKQSKAGGSYKHAVMPIIDIQIGYKAPVKEREKTTIFMTPKDKY